MRPFTQVPPISTTGTAVNQVVSPLGSVHRSPEKTSPRTPHISTFFREGSPSSPCQERYTDDENFNAESENYIYALPKESQLVLLCLDYLRTLIRSHNIRELEEEHALNHNAISHAVTHLSSAFFPPNKANEAEEKLDEEDEKDSLPKVDLHQNTDPFKKVIYAEDDLSAVSGSTPSKVLRKKRAASRKSKNKKPQYIFDDSHPSNAYRFFALNGLSTPPLSLGEVVSSGLVGLNARTRRSAEEDICDNEMFHQFLDAVCSKGFFDLGGRGGVDEYEEKVEHEKSMEDIYRAQFQKVVEKFRIKMAAQAALEEEKGRTILSPSSFTTVSTNSLLGSLRSHKGFVPIDKTRALATRMASMHRKEHKHIHEQFFGDLQDEEKEDEIAEDGPKIIEYHKDDVEHAERFKTQGNKFMQKKQFGDAVQCYSNALRICPSGPQSHIYYSNRSAAFLSMRNYQEAAIDNERALALDPTYGKAHARLGWAFFAQGKFQDALGAYELAMKYDPDNAPSHKKQWAAAKEKLDALENERDGYVNDANTSGGASMNDSRSRHTTSVFDQEDQAAKQEIIRQKEADALKSKGNTLMQQREYENAIQAYTEAINMCPHGPTSYVYFSNRAAALCYVERYEEAELDAEESLSLNPEYGKAYARLGLARFFLEDYEGSVDAYEHALHYEPDNAASKSYLAKSKARLSAS